MINHNKITFTTSSRNINVIMSAFAYYLKYNPDNIINKDKHRMAAYLALHYHVINKLLNDHRGIITMSLPKSIISTMLTAMKWSASHHGLDNPNSPQELHNAMYVLNEIDPDNDHIHLFPFSKEDVILISNLLPVYMPQIVLRFNMFPHSVHLDLPDIHSEQRKLDVNPNTLYFIMLVLKMGKKRIFNSASEAQKSQWKLTWSKVAGYHHAHMNKFIASLNKSIRMARHSFVREALDNIYKYADHKHLFAFRMITQANAHPVKGYQLLQVPSSIRTMKKLYGHKIFNAKQEPLFKAYLKRLEMMNKRGRKYVTYHSTKSKLLFRLSKARTSDVENIVSNIEQTLKRGF